MAIRVFIIRLFVSSSPGYLLISFIIKNKGQEVKYVQEKQFKSIHYGRFFIMHELFVWTFAF